MTPLPGGPGASPLSGKSDKEEYLPLTPAEVYQRMVDTGSIDPACPACRDYFGTIHKPKPHSMAPSHKAKDWCESGKRNHCSCDRCF